MLNTCVYVAATALGQFDEDMVSAASASCLGLELRAGSRS
jgi:hypothetical protein